MAKKKNPSRWQKINDENVRLVYKCCSCKEVDNVSPDNVQHGPPLCTNEDCVEFEEEKTYFFTQIKDTKKP